MGKYIKVSVIVPVFNTEKYLSECIESLVDQKFVDYEIILINDGSTDRSQEIIDLYMKAGKSRTIGCQK